MDRWDGALSVEFKTIKEVVIDAAKGAWKDHILHWGAAIAFYAALSFAPLLLMILILTSFFADADWAAARLSTILGNFLPDESEGQLRDFVSNAVRSRNRVGVFSAATFLYSGSRVFASLTRALHVIYEQEEERQFVREVISQIVMLVTLGGMFLLALSSRFFFGLASGDGQLLQRFIGGLVQIFLLFVAFMLIYRFVPSDESEWKPPIAGALVATALFVIIRPLFVFYLDRFGNQEVVYGSLASLVILLLWVWIGAIIALIGGEIASSTRKLRHS